MDWKKIVGTITQVAPMIGGLLGGPLGAAGGQVVNMVASALGCEPSQEAIAATVTANPDALLKLKQLELDNQTELHNYSLKMIGLEIDDRKDARAMHVAETGTTGKRDNEDKVFDWCIVIGLFCIIAAMIVIKPPESTILGGLIGTVSTAFIAVVQFRKGTTVGSEKKTDMIYNSTPNVPKKEV